MRQTCQTTQELLAAGGLPPPAPGTLAYAFINTGKALCKNHGEHSDFGMYKRVLKNEVEGISTYCRLCLKERNNKKYKSNPKAWNKRELKRRSKDKRIDLVRYRYNSQRNHVLHKGKKEWTITLTYIRKLFKDQAGRCAYTNLTLKDMDMSIDRIDSNKGYIPGNVQLVIPEINFMKQQYSDQKFRMLCKLVTENK